MEQVAQLEQHPERDAMALAHASGEGAWTNAPLALHAAELAGLTEKEIGETIWSLLSLAKSFGHDEVVLLDIEHRASHGAGFGLHSRIDDLRGAIVRMCAEHAIYPPQISMERQQCQVDLHLYIGACRSEAA